MDAQSIVVGAAGLMLLIVIPGLALSLAVFPKKDELDSIERLGFSFVLGLVPQVVQYFLDKNFSVEVNTSTTLGVMAAFTLLGLAVWKMRQK